MVAWNESYKIVDTIPVIGADSLNGIALANTDAVDKGFGVVNLTTAAAHGLLAGSAVLIEGSVNYNGLHEILEVPETDEINIDAKYIAEELAGTETVKIALTSKQDFKFMGFRLNIAVAPGQADIMTITLDSIRGAGYDVVIYSKDLDAVTDLEYINPNVDLPFRHGDILRVAWPNVANRTFGIEFFIAPLN